MQRPIVPSILASLLLALPCVALATPPAHAPAHGYRAKAKDKDKTTEHRHRDSGGFEVVFDSERGVRIAVGFPGVYFEAGHFYRMHDGHWQVSARADGGWKAMGAIEPPEPIRKVRAHPGPAKMKAKGKSKKH